MPEENENIEDFISLWKKKIASEKKASIKGDSLNKIEDLQKENEDLKLKIAENLQLITKSEEILRAIVNEKEKLKLEKEEALANVSFRLTELQQENVELSNKVKSMDKSLMKKDEELKEKDNLISSIQKTQIPVNNPKVNVSNTVIEELKGELSKKNTQILALEDKIKDLNLENKTLNTQIVEKMKSMPIDYVLPVSSAQNSVIKPLPPEGVSLPLETLCQDLQTDLNKYKRIVEKLTKEKSQLKQVLEEKGDHFNASDIDVLKSENESLKQDLEKIQQSLKNREIEITQVAMRQVEDRIMDLESKLKEKENIIAELKLSHPIQTQGSKGSTFVLIEDLQNQINKLKLLVIEKDQKIFELNNQLNKK
jgi:chromosome segregation ATPase